MKGEREDERLNDKAISVGRNLYDEQIAKDLGAAELQERFWEESRNGLKAYRQQIWQGYTQRSLESQSG